MCNYREQKDEFSLNDYIRIKGKISNFELYIQGKLILRNCKTFSFINNTLFITKSQNTIYVFVNSKIMKTYTICENGQKHFKFKFNGITIMINEKCEIKFKN